MKDYQAQWNDALCRILDGKLVREFDSLDTKQAIATAIMEMNAASAQEMIKDIFGVENEEWIKNQPGV